MIRRFRLSSAIFRIGSNLVGRVKQIITRNAILAKFRWRHQLLTEVMQICTWFDATRWARIARELFE